MRDGLKGERKKVRLGVAEHAAQRRVDAEQATVERGDGDADGRVIQREPPALFGRCQGGTDAALFRDVPADAPGAEQLAPAPDAVTRRLPPAGRAVRAGELHVARPTLAVRD